MNVAWACPKCGADANVHGKGGDDKCQYGTQVDCPGFLCECDEDTGEDHGNTFADPCTSANCYHCGWGGTFPIKPKGMQAWEKKALDAGWSMPEARKKELKLGDAS